MRILIPIITAGIVGIVVLCVLLCGKKSKEGFEETKTIAHEKHNIPFFPEFPKPLRSNDHPKMLRAELENAEFCGDCSELEQKLVAIGKDAMAQIQSGQIPTIPDVQTEFKSYSDSCKPCQMLLTTWERYFKHIKALSAFVRSGTLPVAPEVDKSKCKTCETVQKACKDYADALLSELNCFKGISYIEDAKKRCQKTEFPKHNFGKLSSCCEGYYNAWMQYIFALNGIIKYVREED